MRAGSSPAAGRRACAVAFAAALAACGGQNEEVFGRPAASVPEAAAAAPEAAAPVPPAAGTAAIEAAQAQPESAEPAPSGDTAITRQVRRAFLADPQVRHTRLAVETRAGVVTLRGNVGTPEYAERAVAVARGVPGVADVRSEVMVSLYVPARAR